MSLLSVVKRASILTGLYRPARWLSRRLRPYQLRALREAVEFFRSVIPAGALCFDVGANIGEKSEALLDAGARVVAFEPNPLVLPELLARCRHRPEWSVVQAALGRGPAIATLHAKEHQSLSSLEEGWGAGREVATYSVPVVTLDSAIQFFGTPYFCKIDVEGWELEVFLGLTQPIPLVSFEFHLSERDIKKTLACLERLEQFGSSQINLTPAESTTLHLGSWMSIEHFLAWFPGDLSHTLPGFQYGDILVMNNAAQQAYAADVLGCQGSCKEGLGFARG